jgi:hypothetical protein
MSRESRILLGGLLLAYLIFGVFFAWVLVSHDYEIEYLVLGSLAVRGEIGLYQDEVTGQWAPLPFWVYGLTQVVFGPSLFLPRLLSLGLGAAALVLVFRIAERWAGALGATAAAALVVTHGLTVGYFAMVDFAAMSAVVQLLGIYVLFCTAWRRRELIAMAIFAVLFLVKPNYWPAIPFVLGFLLWRSRSWSARLALALTAIALPSVFFALDPAHLKLLAYVPVLRAVVAPLGYHPWFALLEDAAALGLSDYFDASWGSTLAGRVAQLSRSGLFFLKRYAVWLALLGALGLLEALRARRPAATRGPWSETGLRFTTLLFAYLVACQFVILGPWSKQAVGYAGAVAPLLAIVIGCLLAAQLERTAVAPAVRGAVAAAFVGALLVSPWVHRHHNLPRTISLPAAAVPTAWQAAHRLASAIPAGERRVFLLGDPLLVHLAGRRAYVRQSHQHRWMFTSLRDTERYRRSGLWGAAELERWLGADARYAILESEVVTFYRRRTPFRDVLLRMDRLLAEHFTLQETIDVREGDALLIYRRRG